MPGKYYLDLYLGDAAGDVDVVKDAISFEVFPRDIFGTGKLPPASAGPFFVAADWIVQEVPNPVGNHGVVYNVAR
jgi:hypothetical protein